MLEVAKWGSSLLPPPKKKMEREAQQKHLNSCVTLRAQFSGNPAFPLPGEGVLSPRVGLLPTGLRLMLWPLEIWQYPYVVYSLQNVNKQFF